MRVDGQMGEVLEDMDGFEADADDLAGQAQDVARVVGAATGRGCCRAGSRPRTCARLRRAGRCGCPWPPSS